MSPVARTRKVPGRRRGIHPLAIALAAIFVTVFITYYGFSHSLPFQGHYTVYALVDNSVNVRTDSPVRIAGIDVGAVQGTSPYAGSRLTRIAFTMNDNGLPLHTDATIRIRDRLFLEGGYYLELDPGSPSAPVAREGFTIPPSQTATPVQFYKVLSGFDLSARTDLKNVLDTFNEGFSPSPGQPLSDSGAGGFKRAIPQLTPTLKDIAWINQALRGTHQGDLETLLSSASQVTSTLAGNSTQLVDLVTGLNRTSTALAATDGALGQSIVGLDQLLRSSPTALSTIDHALPPVAILAIALDPSLKLAPPLVDAITGAVRELATVVAPAERRQLLTSLKATFQQFPAILRQLAIVFPITKQVSDCLRTHVTPMLTKQVPDGSLSTGRPVWQDFVHFLPGVAGASGSFDANGPYTRVVAGAGTNTLSGGTLSSLPIIGQLIGSAPPSSGSGSSSLLGARPAWVGDLKPSYYRPDVPCSTQKIPSLAAPAAAPDLHAADSSAPAPVTLSSLRTQLAKRGVR